MPTDQAPSKVLGEPALLERARLALQALQFEEEAARYRAACAELMEAIADAEAGNEAPLKRWLDARRGIRTSATVAPESQAPESQAPESNTPWVRMQEAARERELSRAASRAETVVDAAEQADNAPAADLFPGASDLVLQAAANREPQPVRKKRMVPPHLIASLVVHGLMIIGLGWWVVAIAQPKKEWLITAGAVESQEVSLETTLDTSQLESSLTSESEPAPNLPMEQMPIDLPQIAAVDQSVGARLAESTLGSATGLDSLTHGTGTKLGEGVAFFGSQAVGNTFVFVVDCSPSMARDRAFDHAKSELLRSLSSLTPKQRFFILFFGKEVLPIRFPGREPESFLLPATSENLEKTVQWLQRASIQKDGRPPIDAVKQAIAMRPDGIFLLFDGDTKVDDWTGKIRALNRTDDLLSQGETKVPIHVVHFFRDEFSLEMKRLADENEGTYRFVPRPQPGGLR